MDRIWSIVPVGLRLDLRGRRDRRRRRCRPTHADGAAGHGLGRAPDVQLRPQGRLHRHGGLPLGGAARPHEAVAVPAVQPLLHRAVPERPARADHPARVHRVAESRAAERVGCRLRGAVRRLPGRRVRRRPAAVGLPQGEGGRRRPPRAGLRDDRAVPRQPASELLLRAGAVVGVLRDRRDRGGGIRAGPLGWRAQLDDRRRGPADAAVHRVDDLHRVDHGVEVPRLRRVPADDVDARAAAAATAPGAREVRSPKAEARSG